MGKAVRCPTSPLLPDFLASYGTPMQLLELGDSSGDTRGKRKLDQDFRSGERGKVLYSSRKAELSPGGGAWTGLSRRGTHQKIQNLLN